MTEPALIRTTNSRDNLQQILHKIPYTHQLLTFETLELQIRYASKLQVRRSSFKPIHFASAGLTSVAAQLFPSFLLCLVWAPFIAASDPLCFPKMQCFKLGQSSLMDWQSLAMKSTELNWAGLGLGDALASSERMDERMWWMQARQPLRKASSTAGESVKRLKDDDAEERSAGPEEAEVEMESVEQNSSARILLDRQSSTFVCLSKIMPVGQ